MRASSTSRMPLRRSLPGHRLLIHSTSFQLSVGSNCSAVHFASTVTLSMPRTWPALLPKVFRLPRSTLPPFADETAVAHDVKLKPERLVDRRRNVFDRADRHGRQRERNVGRLR